MWKSSGRRECGVFRGSSVSRGRGKGGGLLEDAGEAGWWPCRAFILMAGALAAF